MNPIYQPPGDFVNIGEAQTAVTPDVDPTRPNEFRLPNLASANLGSKILFATNDFFAEAENLLKDDEPVFIPEKFTEFGKWMDGWETARKRSEGHDWCIIQLGVSGILRRIHLDTAFFTGNQAPQFSIQATCMPQVELDRRSEIGTSATKEELNKAAAYQSEKWTTIIPQSKLRPGYPNARHHVFEVNHSERVTHLRLNLYPDGGIARLHALGEVAPDWENVTVAKELDLLSVVNGAIALNCSDSHYGSPQHLLQPNRSKVMKDGWETARNPERPSVFVKGSDGHIIMPGKHWALLKLGHRGCIHRFNVDTNWFKGNFPESCIIEGQDVAPNGLILENQWKTLLQRTPLQAHFEHYFEVPEDKKEMPITHIRITIFPDGGVSRLRGFGHILK